MDAEAILHMSTLPGVCLQDAEEIDTTTGKPKVAPKVSTSMNAQEKHPLGFCWCSNVVCLQGPSIHLIVLLTLISAVCMHIVSNVRFSKQLGKHA